MKKTDELSTPSSCLNKAADDEPIFVLRAKDPLGAMTVREWARNATMHEEAKRAEARALADQMDSWREGRRPVANKTSGKKKLFSMYVGCGRSGELEGKFVLGESEQETLEKLYGETIYFGEVLGKHSDVAVVLKREHIVMVTDNQEFLEKAHELAINLDSGFNPLDFENSLSDDDDDCEEDEEEDERDDLATGAGGA